MKQYKIAVIAGDGIGKEVVPEGIRILEAAGRKFDIGFQFDENGKQTGTFSSICVARRTALFSSDSIRSAPE